MLLSHKLIVGKANIVPLLVLPYSAICEERFPIATMLGSIAWIAFTASQPEGI
jgi:hypothetical protein